MIWCEWLIIIFILLFLYHPQTHSPSTKTCGKSYDTKFFVYKLNFVTWVIKSLKLLNLNWCKLGISFVDSEREISADQ